MIVIPEPFPRHEHKDNTNREERVEKFLIYALGTKWDNQEKSKHKREIVAYVRKREKKFEVRIWKYNENAEGEWDNTHTCDDLQDAVNTCHAMVGLGMADYTLLEE